MLAQLVVDPRPAVRVAEAVTRRVRASSGAFQLGLSGAAPLVPVFDALAAARLAWSRVGVWQLDEVVVPESHPARLWAQLWGHLAVPAAFSGVPVDTRADPSGVRAAERHAEALGAPPCRGVLDLAVLALAPDGSIAALSPNDAALRERRDFVALPARAGLVWVTVTLAALARARGLLLVAEGAACAPALSRLIAGDVGLPAGRLRHPDFTVFADPAAAAGVRRD